MVQIREATDKDVENMTSLLKILFSIEEDFTFDPALQSQGLQQMLNSKQGCIFVAEHQNNILGMCTGQLTISTAEGGPSLLIEDVVIKKKWRRKGIGKKLVDSVSKWAQQSGATRMQLLADQTNTDALNFYKKNGWKSTQLICLRKHIH